MLLQAFNPEPVLPAFSGRPDQVERVLKARFHDAMTKLQPHKKELDLLIVILPDNNGSLYGINFYLLERIFIKSSFFYIGII